MTVELTKNFEFFERTTPNTIEKLIREQGDDVCHNVIGKDYIHLCTFGRNGRPLRWQL